MTSKRVTNYKELMAAVDLLGTERLKQEEALRKNVKNLRDALDPINMAKDYFKRIAEDNELHQSALRAGLNVGTRFILDKLFGNNKDEKPHKAATIFEKLVDTFVK